MMDFGILEPEEDETFLNVDNLEDMMIEVTLDSGACIPAPDEEAQPQKAIRTPAKPSAEEVAENCDNGHLPYRRWCSDCVEAFGRECAHKAIDS